MVEHWRSTDSSWTKLVRTPTCWIVVRKTVRKSSIGTWMGKISELGMPIGSSIWKQMWDGRLFANIQPKPNRREIKMSISCHTWLYNSTNAHSSQDESQLYIFEDNEGVIKMIIKRQKSNNETSVKNPQSCNWLVVWQHQLGLKNQNQIFWIQEPTCGHIIEKKLRIWWMESSSLFFEHYESPDVPLQQFMSFEQKTARTECYVEEMTRRNFQGKFDNDEAEIYEFGDGEAETFYIGAVQYVEYEERFSARYVRFRKNGEC